MEAEQELFRWAQERGVVLSGIEPQHIPGQGIGIIATRKLKVSKHTHADKQQSRHLTHKKRQENPSSQCRSELSIVWTQFPRES
jgi:hypothetical protein